MRAAILHGPGDLRVEQVAEPVAGAGRGARARRGRHDLRDRREDVAPRAPDPRRRYPARFGHETAGTRADTRRAGARRRLARLRGVPAVPRAAAADLPRAALDPRRLRARRSPRRRPPCTPCRTGSSRPAPRWPSRSRRRCTPSARAPARALAPDAGVLGAGRWARCSPPCWSPRGAPSRSPTPTPSGARRPRRSARLAAESLADHDVVFEAVGRPDAWRAAVAGVRAGRLRRLRRRLRGRQRRPAPDPAAALRRGRPARRLPPRAGRVRPRAARCSPTERSTGARWRPARSRWSELPAALASGNDGPARKWVVVAPAAEATRPAPGSAGARRSGASRRSPRARGRGPARRAGR